MFLSVTVLGSGTSVPSAWRMAPAHLIRATAGGRALALALDCGSGSSTSLVRAGVPLESLAGVILTHLHPDHTADLVPHLFALANPFGPVRESDLRLWGPDGTAGHLEALRSVYGRWVQPRQGRVVVSEVGHGDAFTVGPLEITPFRVAHTRASLAFRVALAPAGGSICLSGDTGPCPALEEAARGVDVLLCECAGRDDAPVTGHMSPSEVGRLAAAAGCREVVLTHFYDDLEATLPLARVQAHFSGPARLAEDGMEIRLQGSPVQISCGRAW